MLRATIISLIILGLVLGVTFSPNSIQAQSDSHSLNEQELANLTAFAQLYGYVRFFHPADETIEADWDKFALDGAAAVLQAESAEELVEVLQSIFAPVAPTVQIFLTTDDPPPLPESLTQPDSYVMWQVHRGFGLGVRGEGDQIYNSFRRIQEVADVEFGVDASDPADPPIYDLDAGVSARVPRSLYTFQSNALDHYQGEKPDIAFETKTERVGTIIIAWSILEHFYPYWEVVDTDWDAVLETSLKDAASASSINEMQTIFQRLISELHDGHGQAWFMVGDNPLPFAPFTLTYIDGNYVVAASASNDVPVGSQIIAINDQLIEDIMSNIYPLFSASTEQYLHSWDWIAFNGTATYTETLTIQLRPLDGRGQQVVVPRELTGVELQELVLSSRPEPVIELEEGVWYIDLTRFDNIAFNLNRGELAQAEGIIFDMRGYPAGVPPSLLGHLTDSEISTAQFLVPYITQPHFQNVEYTDESWTIQPGFPRFTDNVVFITDGSAISYAETLMGIVEYYEFGEIVGIPTAGTNGNVVQYELPGGFNIRWTGLRVLKHDGSQHHGVGIQPTIPVTQTVEDLVNGEDTMLNRALEVIHANRSE
ncbi:MAG: S41 family peptidase [Chloroflexi bacterium]|nr:S41 family peptidase [Chloroflexota bacterium]